MALPMSNPPMTPMAPMATLLKTELMLFLDYFLGYMIIIMK